MIFVSIIFNIQIVTLKTFVEKMFKREILPIVVLLSTCYTLCTAVNVKLPFVHQIDRYIFHSYNKYLFTFLSKKDENSWQFQWESKKDTYKKIYQMYILDLDFVWGI